MAWTFRKRIKIAPGVHVNLSKGGVSTSIGPRGAKLNIGPKGTYMTTGIPGTGIYNRQKIGDGIETPANNPQTSQFVSTPMDNTPSNNNSHGCLKVFIWVLLIFSIIMFFVGLVSMNDSDKQPTQMVSPVELPEGPVSDNDLSSSTIVEPDITNSTVQVADSSSMDLTMVIIFGIIIVGCIVVLAIISNSASTAKERKQNDTEEIQKLRSRIESEEDETKKKILSNHLSHLLQTDIDLRLTPLVEKYSKKASKSSKPEIAALLKQFEDEKLSETDEVNSLKYDIIAELSEEEIEKYAAFCDMFRSFKNSKKTWMIDSSEVNTERKSSADTLVKKHEIQFGSACFQELYIPYEVPYIPISGLRQYYIYPRFVIVTKNSIDFDVIPLIKVHLRYKSTRFQEDGIAPSDADRVGTTYMYVNKNGGPDMRYSYNPSIPILLYGDITIEPFGNTFQVSNNIAAMQLSTAYLSLTAANLSAMPIDRYAKELAEVKAPEPQPQKIDFAGIPLENKDLVEAAKLAVIYQSLGTSDIQRKLGIGYARAGRIREQLEAYGIIGPAGSNGRSESLVGSLDELEDILQHLLSPQEPSNGISKQYFYDVASAAQRLQEFGNRLSKNEEFAKLIEEKISGNVQWNGTMLTSGSEKIPIYLWADVLNCYSGLGHEIVLSNNEGLGLLLFNCAMLDSTFSFEYEHLDMYREKLIPSSEKMLREMKESMSGSTDVFLLEVCLRDFDKQLHNQYVVLLYRFASLVAKADKSVSSVEAEWLNKIMNLKESEGVEDIIAPIAPVSPKKNTTSRVSKPKAAKALESLIGLSSVKAEINSLTNYIKVQKMRQEKGMKVTPVSYHCVFTGNPGTGKTTVARIVSEIYKELGILSKGHLVETDRSGLVAEYVGQTAVKTNKIIDSALDGILFIDEAYSLVDGGNSDYGKEAISTLLKRMEDDRDRLVVILAGYTDDMKRFIDSNPGLQSRFNRYIEFPDYSADELYQIFESSAQKYEYTLTDNAKEVLKSALEKAVGEKDKNFGNGRFVRNLFEKVVEHQANRLSTVPEVTADILATIEADDIKQSL